MAVTGVTGVMVDTGAMEDMVVMADMASDRAAIPVGRHP